MKTVGNFFEGILYWIPEKTVLYGTWIIHRFVKASDYLKSI
jgi:hypothetical protein